MPLRFFAREGGPIVASPDTGLGESAALRLRSSRMDPRGAGRTCL
jgi:hypothetical protein